MKKTLVTFLMLSGMLGIVFSQQASCWMAQERAAPSSNAQENNPPAPQNDPLLLIAEGTLTNVDAQKQIIWIKAADGLETQFSYSKETQVIGEDDTVEGLARMTANDLKVYYRVEGGANIAVRIEVQAHKS